MSIDWQQVPMMLLLLLLVVVHMMHPFVATIFQLMNPYYYMLN